jgi:hypothetical protein
MIDGRNLTTEQMKAALEHLSETSGKAASDIEQAINSGNWENFVQKNMNPMQAKTLKMLLEDRQAADKLLETPQAQALLEKLLNTKRHNR